MSDSNGKVNARRAAIEWAQLAAEEAEAIAPEWRGEYWEKLFAELRAVSPLTEHVRRRRPIPELTAEQTKEANERYAKLNPQAAADLQT